MPFKDYNEIIEPLELPINGKLYRIPPISLEDGIRITEGLTPGNTKFTDEDLYRCTLGTALDEMRADSVRSQAIYRAALTSLADWQRDRATAEVVWETGSYPKAVTPPKDSTPTSTGAEPTTPRRASTSGTSRSRKASSK